MIEITERRLRVRNDGYGKQPAADAKLSDFDKEDAIVILGNPGMGKTTLLRTASEGTSCSVRAFVANPTLSNSGALFLDGLDEFRILAKGEEVTTRITSALCILGKPPFRISCRAADWFGSSDLEVLRAASASGRIVVLEILPLSNDEIRKAVTGVVPDAASFVQEATDAGLGTLLTNPHTLELIAHAWTGPRKPRNKFEAFDLGVSKLLLESRVLGPDKSNTKSLRQAAGAIASTILLSNSVGVVRNEGVADDLYFHLSLVPACDIDVVDEVLKRRLFSSSDTHQFEFVHRTITEFLAAEDLVRRNENSLPLSRILALMSGMDGRPSASLRGLFAWLMCRLPTAAEAYVGLDPYAVSTYGDTSVLSPAAQRAILKGLQSLVDPWFLSSEDERGSFRDLANASTAPVIVQILEDAGAGVHLKIAILEAIANSKPITGFASLLRKLIVEPSGNTWLRLTAVRAFARSVNHDDDALENLDTDLSTPPAGGLDAAVRVALLEVTRSKTNLANRVLSILRQAKMIANKNYISGHFYSLGKMANDLSLDALLDGAPTILQEEHDSHYEIRSLFEEWFRRRLSIGHPIDPSRLAHWLRSIFNRHHNHERDLQDALTQRFSKEPSLFEQTFDVVSIPTERTKRGRGYIAYDLRDVLPTTLWPHPVHDFLLDRAKSEAQPERSADLFGWYLGNLPVSGLTSAAIDSAFSFLEKRQDVAKVLGNWNACEIPQWLEEQSARKEK